MLACPWHDMGKEDSPEFASLKLLEHTMTQSM